MSCFSGANIINSSSVLILDAANKNSYSGTGTTWTDLSNSKNNAIYNINNGIIVYDPLTKSMHRNALNVGADLYRPGTTVHLDQSFTMSVMAIVYQCHGGTANGILTNHSHAHNTGSGINVKHISDTDFRISCNTGNGSSRTYMDYYGTTNIKDIWSYLTVRFHKPTNTLSLLVNGISEYSITYAMATRSDYVDLFNWSTTNNTVANYRPRCKVSHASVHNIALTDAQIVSNFNALRGRFSI